MYNERERWRRIGSLAVTLASRTAQRSLTLAQVKSELVSDDAELLILVDASDREVGTLDKQACHNGSGILHRAFSAFVFNADGDLLIQQRAANKRLWPNYWSNSCCSHPRAGEDTLAAAQRRCEQELGISTSLQYVYKFEYHAEFGTLGAEHELCWVYVGEFDGSPIINETEIQAFRWIAPDRLDMELSEHPDTFTPWFKMEWTRLRTEFAGLTN